MATTAEVHAESVLASAERSGDERQELVLLVWGDPASGFKHVGPVLPGDPELEYVTDVLLRDTYWWYVPVSTLEQAKHDLGYREG